MYKKLKKAELIDYVLSLGITDISNKTKDQLIMLVENKVANLLAIGPIVCTGLQAQNNATGVTPIISVSDIDEVVPVAYNSYEVQPVVNTKPHLYCVLKELLSVTPKDKTRKVCKQCNELGHSQNSISCKYIIETNNKLISKIKSYLLSQNCLDGKTLEETYKILSEQLNISEHHVKQLYNEIQPEALLNRPLDINEYIKSINLNSIKCHECSLVLYNIHTNTNRLWKGTHLCEICWCKYVNERNNMWHLISQYKPVICYICGQQKIYEEQRFNYDHINMFDKLDSICSMVNDGVDMQTIYNEIDKCQILCISCHHKVTDLENKIGFTRIKKRLTQLLNTEKISSYEYDMQLIKYQALYKEKMLNLYEMLK